MESLWTVNQRSVLAGCQMAARIMVADGTPGALVNIGSVHARSGNPGMEGYAGTKGAISAMGRAMAWSLGPHGIRVNALCPGLTQTETVLQAMQDPATAAELCSWHATNRVSTVEDIGNAAVFLLSDLSAALTGERSSPIRASLRAYEKERVIPMADVVLRQVTKSLAILPWPLQGH